MLVSMQPTQQSKTFQNRLKAKISHAKSISANICLEICFSISRTCALLPAHLLKGLNPHIQNAIKQTLLVRDIFTCVRKQKSIQLIILIEFCWNLLNHTNDEDGVMVSSCKTSNDSDCQILGYKKNLQVFYNYSDLYQNEYRDTIVMRYNITPD